MRDPFAMNAKERYISAFCSAFEIEENAVESLEYQGIPEWDSVGHMTLMGELEDVFEITLEMDDIIDFSSYTKGIETLAKYGVLIE